jgi:hypothetical protein
MNFPQLIRQLEWLESIGVDSFNFSVLAPTSMLNDKLARSRSEVLSAASWGWARNREGQNIYIRPATGPAWSVVILDDVPLLMAKKIARKYAALVIETSADNSQVWIATATLLSIEERASVQRALALKIKADPCSVSGDHFGRAAGFRNRKPNRKNFLVDVVDETRTEMLDTSPYLLTQEPSAPGLVLSRVSKSEIEDVSRDEFGWALGWLRSGHAKEVGIRRLAENAMKRGKRKTLYGAEDYARKTFERAQGVLISESFRP